MNELERLQAAISDACGDHPGPLLYRGESQDYPEVSSTLWRASNDWRKQSDRNLNDLQRILTNFASAHDNPEARKPRRSEQFYAIWSGGYDPGEMTEQEVELMGELQHWGAATNLIDFTRDMNVAIYFACEEEWQSDGRILIVGEHDWARWRLDAKTPSHRAEAQESVFLRPPGGVVTPWREVKVPYQSKPELLDQLSQLDPPISAPRVYNDIFGYIRLSNRYVQGMDYYHEGMELLNRYHRLLREGDPPPGMLDKIRDLHNKAVEKLFWIGGVWAELGRMHFYSYEFGEAQEMIEKALRMDYRQPYMYGILAEIAIHEGKKSAALERLRDAFAVYREREGSEDATQDVFDQLEALKVRATAMDTTEE